MPDRWSSSNRHARLPPGWSSTIAPRILQRDHGICYLCGKPGADAVDHVNPGDDHSDSNLKAVHDSTPPHCHRHKSGVEGAIARWGEIAGRRPPERHPGAVD